MGYHKYLYKRYKGIKKTIHRQVMEEKIGRPLYTHEHVYHINGDSLDNTVDNLIIIEKKSRK